MGKSKIEWTEHVWNPVRGCTRISEGCRNCYAERMAARFSVPTKDYEGTFQPPARFNGFARMTPSGPRWTGRVELIPDMLDIPLRRKKPTVYFVNSMSDLFHENLPDAAIDRVFAVMALCPQHKFLVLTKRAERMREYVRGLEATAANWQRKLDEKGVRRDCGTPFNATSVLNIRWLHAGMGRAFPDSPWPLPNVGLGVSCEDQATADKRIPYLLQTPAAMRFLSLEPMLGPVDLTPYLLGRREKPDADLPDCFMISRGLDWVIAGGESGPGARPAHPDWFRSVRDQCATAGVPFFLKQWGEWEPQCQSSAKTGFGSAIEYWAAPYDTGDCRVSFRVGKRAAGRLLDGREHNDRPEGW